MLPYRLLLAYRLCSLIGLLLLVCPSCYADLLVYEGFSYTPGVNITGLNGGTGLAGAYRDAGDQGGYIASQTLTFPNLLTSGYAGRTTEGLWSGNFRDLPAPLANDGTTIFLSFLARPLDPVTVGRFNTERGLEIGRIIIGKGSNHRYGIDSTVGGAFASSDVEAHQNETVFLVVRLESRPGGDIVELYINPTPGHPMPAAASVRREDLDVDVIRNIGFVCDGAWAFDELRIGTTWEDVTPVASTTVSGRITLQGAIDQAQPLTFAFRPMDGSTPFTRTVTLNANRTYTLQAIPFKSYSVRIKGEKWLAKTVDVDARDGSVSNVNTTLLGGDANNDNVADALDLALLIDAFNTESGEALFNADADFNVDGSCDALDLAILITNFNTEGDF